jgi:hypothetical protein
MAAAGGSGLSLQRGGGAGADSSFLFCFANVLRIVRGRSSLWIDRQVFG